MSSTIAGFLLTDGRTVCRRKSCFESAPRLGTTPKDIRIVLAVGPAAGRACATCAESLVPGVIASQPTLLGLKRTFAPERSTT